jgi:hypothetical protein
MKKKAIKKEKNQMKRKIKTTKYKKSMMIMIWFYWEFFVSPEFAGLSMAGH